jgi:hypothetical protein
VLHLGGECMAHCTTQPNNPTPVAPHAFKRKPYVWTQGSLNLCLISIRSEIRLGLGPGPPNNITHLILHVILAEHARQFLRLRVVR